jgi:hypothetical protein
MLGCVVCGKPAWIDFCATDYKMWKEAILNKEPWVRELKNDGQRERRRINKEWVNVSLDNLMEREFDDKTVK